MKRYLLCILLLLSPFLVEASDSHIHYKLNQIAESYADSYLTYFGAIKVWYGNILSRFGIKLDPSLKNYVQGHWAFQSSVTEYSIIIESDSLNLDLSPTEFKAIFNYEVRKQLGDKAANQINLDIHRKYLAPGE